MSSASSPPSSHKQVYNLVLSTCSMSVKLRAIPGLASSFSRIHQLPQLETINLVFFEAIDGRQFDFPALTDSFSIRAPSKLTSLSLHNLYTWDLTPLESAPFKTVLKNLRHRDLRLSVLFDRTGNLVASLNRWMHFWGTLCHRLVLAPTQHTLTELTLQSNRPVGASSGLGCTFQTFARTVCAGSSRPSASSLLSFGMAPPLSSSHASCSCTRR